jgi:hypothetical protein
MTGLIRSTTLFCTMKHFLVNFWAATICLSSVAQNDSRQDDQLPWSSTRKLVLSDFVIRTSTVPGSSSHARFSMQFDPGGSRALPADLNDRVHNYFIRSDAWIDTSYDVNTSLRYQQTLFDLCEIYTRHFRRDLRENRKALRKGRMTVDELNAKAMSGFAARRIQYDTETQTGSSNQAQIKWEAAIRRELMELREFGLDN